MALNTLDDVFLEALKDIYNAEKQLIKALPKMAKASSTPELKEGFKMHLEETKGQIARIERIFDLLNAPHKGKKCKAMEGLIEEGAEAMEQKGSPELIDAMLIAAARKVEHYEMATYGTLYELAEILGHDQVRTLIGDNLKEEVAADAKLGACARDIVYPASQSLAAR